MKYNHTSHLIFLSPKVMIAPANPEIYLMKDLLYSERGGGR